jgi:lipopolysaccharide transport system ATP-binding protein
VLAVGDAEFQKKCVDKMRAVRRSGRTVLLVSHNLAQIEGLCDRAVALRQGRVVGVGPAAEQVREYLKQARAGATDRVDLRGHPHRTGTDPALTGLAVFASGAPGTVARMSGGFGFELAYELPHKPRDLRVGVILENEAGVRVTAVSPTFQDPHLLDDPPAVGWVRADVPAHNLAPGLYGINVYLQAEGLYDAVEPGGQLSIEADDAFGSGRVLDPKVAVTYQASRWAKSW